MSQQTLQTKSKGAIDSKNCLTCGSDLTFSFRFFGHLGIYSCPNCGFTRPMPTYTIENADLKVEETSGYFVGPDIKSKLKIHIPGLYNLYNALAAASLGHLLHVPYSEISRALENVSAAFGRMEKIPVGDKNILLLLVKNPTGFTQGIETLTYDKKAKNLLVALNDNFADGTDVSWIWDAEIELIKDYTKDAVFSGIRAEDLMVRFKHANFDQKTFSMEKNIGKAIDQALSKVPSGETLYILPTYTAMLEIRKLLAKMGLVKGLLE
jgi:UDP-N-acetylmuramyl tripeptide synthase